MGRSLRIIKPMTSSVAEQSVSVQALEEDIATFLAAKVEPATLAPAPVAGGSAAAVSGAAGPASGIAPSQTAGTG